MPVVNGGAPGVLRPSRLSVLSKDAIASLVVFLVALPLCIGVAIASGVPAELGIITGIVGGLVVGLMPGSRLQVSGPAAGLTVLVYDAVTAHGVTTLGVIVLGAGALQILLGAVRLGRWFQAISLSVVHGMLAGIGLLLIAGQAYALADIKQRDGALSNLLGLPELVIQIVSSPGALAVFGIGAVTIAICVLWGSLPAKVRMVPGPLVAVVVAAGLVFLLDLDAKRIQVGELLGAVRPPTPGDYGKLLDPAVLGLVVAFALIASAESLFSAAAVDRMHDGPRTRYNTELVAQGVGNTVCGLLGALPMTAVIVRSAANVQAGAQTKASRVLHGLWLLLFAVALPGLLQVIPVSALAGVLVYSGWKLLNPGQIVPLWRQDRGEAAVMVVTTGAIIATDLLKGVIVGLVAAVIKSAWDMSRLAVTRVVIGDRMELRFAGNATFLRLPRIVETLDSIPTDRPVTLDLTRVHHLDHACESMVQSWAAQRLAIGSPVRLLLPGAVAGDAEAAGSAEAAGAVGTTLSGGATPERAVAEVGSGDR